MKIRTAVVFGGNSTEHEISVISAVQALGYFDAERYEAVPVYMTKNGDFYTGPELTKIEGYRDIPSLLAKSTQVDFVKDGVKVYLQRHALKKFGENRLKEIDVVFPIVHGTNVEDGTLTGYFATLGLPVAGCNVLASALGMDKIAMKAVLEAADIPVLPCLHFTRMEADDREDVCSRIEERFPYPVIVKPSNLGSSIGIKIAHEREGLLDALDLAFTFAVHVLVEPAITSLREINCAVLGDDNEAVASECEEPLGAGEILDFTDKYIAGNKGGAKGGKAGAKAVPGAKGASGSKGSGMASLQRKLPADLAPEKREEIRSMAVRAFHALNCSGNARIDFMLDTADNDKVYLNELNTIPGSLAFYLWQSTGIPYPELLDRMVKIALDADREKKKTVYTFDSNVLASVRL